MAFVVGVPDDGNNGAKSGMNDNGPPGSRGGAGVVGPELLAFSLALAGSVMITVVILSIIPECLMIGDATMIDGGIETLEILGNLISSQLLLHRAIGFYRICSRLGYICIAFKMAGSLCRKKMNGVMCWQEGAVPFLLC